MRRECPVSLVISSIPCNENVLTTEMAKNGVVDKCVFGSALPPSAGLSSSLLEASPSKERLKKGICYSLSLTWG